MDIRKRSNLWRTAVGCVSLLLLQLNSAFVYADGTETLGTPSISIGSGTGIIAEGIGLEQGPNTLVVDVPAGATVVQAILYWHGYQNDPPDLNGDNDILVNGNPYTGVLIGGPISLQTTAGIVSWAYRADITAEVSPGTNNLALSGLTFDYVSHGAGILVIIDEGATAEHYIDIRDGNDFAYQPFTGLQQVTVPQTFNFAASSEDRMATLDLHYSSVRRTTAFRPSAIEVSVDGGAPTVFNNLLNSNDGQEWDSVNMTVPVPAGATSVTVLSISVDNGAAIPPGTTRGQPASFHWLAAALSVAPPPPPGGEGCTPGFWKNTRKHLPAWVGYTPDQQFSSVFEDAFTGLTLKQVLKAKGGGLNALGRHTVAALLNGANSDISYGMTDADVIAAFNAVYPGTKEEYTALKNEFAAANESGCPINGKTAPSGL